MIISGKQVQGIVKVYGEQNKLNKGIKQEKSDSAQSQDEVILSTNAQEFGQYLSSLQSMSGVRQDKVKDLSERIQSGTYEVDARAVAEKMLGF